MKTSTTVSSLLSLALVSSQTGIQNRVDAFTTPVSSRLHHNSNIIPTFSSSQIPLHAVEIINNDFHGDVKSEIEISSPPLSQMQEQQQIVPKTTPARSGRNALPGWGRKVNDVLGITLVTHADKKHVHALSGATWWFGGNAILWMTWAQQIFFSSSSNRIDVFDGLNPLLGAVCIGATVTALASAPLRHDEKYPSYSTMMRNGMLTGVCTSLLCCTFAIGGITELPTAALQTASAGVISVATMAVLYQAVVDRMPWDFRGTIRDLDLEMPPEAIMVLSMAIGLSWVLLLGLTSSHALLDMNGVMDIDESMKSFLAQMSLALSMTPAGEAVAGSAMLKERFGRKADDYNYKFVSKQSDGSFSTNRFLEALQLTFNFPGPVVFTTAVALATDHVDVVKHFFYIQ